MSMVHSSHGRLAPASPDLLSEVAIVCEPGAGHPRRPDHRALEGVSRRLRPHPRPDLAGRPRLRGLQPPGRATPAASSCRTRPATPARFATATGKANFTVQRPRRPRHPGGPPAAADRALARPVQHHHLRPRRPLPGHQERPPGRLRQPRRPRRPRHPPTARSSTSSASRTDGVERRAPGFRVVAYPTARGVRRRLLPRDQRPRPPRQHRRHEQHPHLEVGRHPPRARLRPTAEPVCRQAALSSRRTCRVRASSATVSSSSSGSNGRPVASSAAAAMRWSARRGLAGSTGPCR